MHHFLRSSLDLFFDASPDSCLEFGPLSFMIVEAARAVLLRIVPRFAGQTDFYVIEIVGDAARNPSAIYPDAVAEASIECDPPLPGHSGPDR